MNELPSIRINIPGCRACGSTRLELYLPLGDQALANNFLATDQRAQPEARYPLEVFYCADCFHSQLGYTVPPEVLFRNYLYVSSTSDLIPIHFAEYAKDMYEQYMKPGDLVVEVASNDGCLLKGFQPYDVKILGVEPALNIATMAEAAGIQTIAEFFTPELVRNTILPNHGQAKVMIANNVFAHVDDIGQFTDAAHELLTDDGVWAIESPHILPMLQHTEFDTVYHEHISYLSLTALIPFFERHHLTLFDVQPTAVHGGSNRMYISKTPRPHTDRLTAQLKAEIDFGINRPETYQAFGERVQALRDELVTVLRDLKQGGHSIAAYGASAKGQTLLQYCGLDPDLIDFIADKSPLKQNRLSPGMHIPVVTAETVLEKQPDYLLILAWNFADEIMGQQAEYAQRGGKFIIPIPTVKIV